MERVGFVREFALGLYTLTDLAARYGVSRKTAYKWIDRFAEEQQEGLKERSRRAKSIPNRTPKDIEDQILELRKRYRTWGAKKLLVLLAKTVDAARMPSRTTVAEILKRNGLVNKRVRRRREGHPGRPITVPAAPNEIWAMDFKGQYRTGNGLYCYPFTVTDLFSRYLLCCDGHPSTATEGVMRSLERVFREYGMPLVFRSDNGAPFASTGIWRLTRLAVWLLKLGITRELIQPGCPQQNGCHERMHRTLKLDIVQPPAYDLRRQQLRHEAFRTEFNQVRPHEALQMRTPAAVHTPSLRPFPAILPVPQYPATFEVRRVSRNGGVRWKGDWLPVGHALIEENVAFEQVADGLWDVHFAGITIGRFDERTRALAGTLGSHYRCGKRDDRS